MPSVLFLRITCLGFSSGLPYFLVLSSLTVWMADYGLSYFTIGLLSWTSVPYVFKLFLAPLIENFKWPYLHQKLGKRRSWGFVMQLTLILSIFMLSFIDPRGPWLWVNCFLILLSAALQDIALEAYRIEHTPPGWMGKLSSASYFGFRLGMWVSGYICFLLADLYSWAVSFRWMAGFMGIGIIALLLSPETAGPEEKNTGRFWASAKQAMTSFSHVPLKSVIFFVFSFKAGDIFIRSFWAPFLLSIGYSKTAIAEIEKLIGVSAMMIGGLLGGWLVTRMGLRRTFLVWGLLQILGAFCFVVQASIGQNMPLLISSMSLNQLAGGIGGTALVTYLSCLCHPPYVATHYALLTSFGSLSRILVTMTAGWYADQVTWVWFFLMAALITCINLFYTLFIVKSKNKNDENKKECDIHENFCIKNKM